MSKAAPLSLAKSFCFVVILCFVSILFNSWATPADAYTLPDTGQTKCYDNEKEISCPSPGLPFYGQDAQYVGPQPAFQDNNDGTVTDVNTGLIWQKSDDQNTTRRTWQQTVDYCESLNLGNKTDWRLPSRRELMSIVNYGRHDPAIDTGFFPNCYSGIYWSGTSWACNPGSVAWFVYFFLGVESTSNKDSTSYVRCVHGNALSPGNYIDNGDGTITDTITGIIWQQSDDGVARTWQAALEYCEGLNLANRTDWRIPNVRELMSIVDDSRYGPAINPVFACRSGSYWSGSSSAYDPTEAWGGYFQSYCGLADGMIFEKNKSENSYVRCVQGGTGAAPQLTLYDFWRKEDPIYANPQADIWNPNFDAQYKVQNTGTATIQIERLALAIHDANNNHLWDMSNPATGQPRYYDNVVLAPGGSHYFEQSVCYFNDPGSFKVVAKAKINGQWQELDSIHFEVVEIQITAKRLVMFSIGGYYPKEYYPDEEYQYYRDAFAESVNMYNLWKCYAEKYTLTFSGELFNTNSNYSKSCENILEMIESQANVLSSNETFVLSFTGHGDPDKLIIIPQNSPPCYITSEQLYNALSKLASKNITLFIVIDACHSGSFQGELSKLNTKAIIATSVDEDELAYRICAGKEPSSGQCLWISLYNYAFYKIFQEKFDLSCHHMVGSYPVKEVCSLYCIELINQPILKAQESLAPSESYEQFALSLADYSRISELDGHYMMDKYGDEAYMKKTLWTPETILISATNIVPILQLLLLEK